VPLFSRDKTRAVQNFILSIVNSECPELQSMPEGPRSESRVSRLLVALVIPIEKKEILTDKSFTALTIEFSSSGFSLAMDRPRGLDQVVVGFRWEGQMNFIRAEAKHVNPMGGGFYRIGFKFVEMMYQGDYPILESMHV